MELLALTCNVKDLSPLQGMPPEKLDITQTKVTIAALPVSDSQIFIA